MSFATGLICDNCQSEYPENKLLHKCPGCEAPLRMGYDLPRVKEYLSRDWPPANGRCSLEQYQKLLPITKPELIDRVTLGESQTPLLPSRVIGSEIGMTDLRFKMEIGPSLSLKDRGSALCALKALEFGLDAMRVSSSGNNASSVAAYAARAGLKSFVFVQKDTATQKLTKMKAFDSHVLRIDGDMRIASQLGNEIAPLYPWLESGGSSPYRITAKRLVAYELVDQMSGDIPDAVIFPCGGSAGIVAADIAFKELHQMGIIPKSPKLIGAQFTACDPITTAFNKGTDQVTPIQKKPSISDALMNNNPYWGKAAIRAARDSGGFFISVSDREVVDCLKQLGAKEGIFVEPAGAVAVTAAIKIGRQKIDTGLNKVVCTITGHGLNTSFGAIEERDTPHLIPAQLSDLQRHIDNLLQRTEIVAPSTCETG